MAFDATPAAKRAATRKLIGSLGRGVGVKVGVGNLGRVRVGVGGGTPRRVGVAVLPRAVFVGRGVLVGRVCPDALDSATIRATAQTSNSRRRSKPRRIEPHRIMFAPSATRTGFSIGK
jgi:hypothetical protein